MVSLAAFALLATLPRGIDRGMAGYALAYDPKHGSVGVHDPRRGFYLIRSIDCDGAMVTLLLTRDRNEVAEMGYRVPGFVPQSGENGSSALEERPLPSLRTPKGVAIGDSPAAVRARLGAPTRTRPHGPFLDLVYVWKPKQEAPHEQRYTFKQGRLIELEFVRGDMTL